MEGFRAGFHFLDPGTFRAHYRVVFCSRIALQDAVQQLRCLVDPPDKLPLKLRDLDNAFLDLRDQIGVFLGVGFGLFEVHFCKCKLLEQSVESARH